MDGPLTALATFAAGMTERPLPAEVTHEAKRRLIDALGCAVAAVDSPPAVVARALAEEVRPAPGAPAASVLGSAQPSSPELAAFANSVMVRYLDFNDSFASARASGGHPSDMIGAIAAAAEAASVPGSSLLVGIVSAYQANGAVPVAFKKLGWDQGLMTGIGAAAGIAAALELDAARAATAMSLATTMGVPLRVTRSGELSMWKGCATAAACRAAVFATSLATAGMTAPGAPFEGRHGLWEQVTGPFELELDPERYGWRILEADTKQFPVEGGMQAVLPALLDVSDGVPLDEIERVRVRTYWGLWFEAASEPEKWDPRTRETADHSLPYVMAVTLRERGIGLSAFDDAAIADESLRPLMQRIEVVEVPEFTGADPTIIGPTEIEIETRNGERRQRRTTVPRGNHANPMTDDELAQKFLGLVTRHARANAGVALLDALWAVDRSDDVAGAMRQWATIAGAEVARDGPITRR